MKRFIFYVAVLSLLCGLSPIVHAEVVADVAADGTITLADGKRILLAGVHMDPEGISILRVLSQKQDLRLQLLAKPAPEAKEYAYAYLQAKYLKFPAKLNDVPDEQEILINEFLIKIGAARVDETHDFSHKTKFLKVQAEAQKAGEGVWSYEAS